MNKLTLARVCVQTVHIPCEGNTQAVCLDWMSRRHNRVTEHSDANQVNTEHSLDYIYMYVEYFKFLPL